MLYDRVSGFTPFKNSISVSSQVPLRSDHGRHEVRQFAGLVSPLWPTHAVDSQPVCSRCIGFWGFTKGSMKGWEVVKLELRLIIRRLSITHMGRCRDVSLHVSGEFLSWRLEIDRIFLYA